MDILPSNVYLIGDAQSRLKNSEGSGASFFNYPGVKAKSLIAIFSDGSGKTLQEISINARPPKGIAIAADYTQHIGKGFHETPWQMYGSPIDLVAGNSRWYGMGIAKQRKFTLVVVINQDLLAKIQKISLKLE